MARIYYPSRMTDSDCTYDVIQNFFMVGEFNNYTLSWSRIFTSSENTIRSTGSEEKEPLWLTKAESSTLNALDDIDIAILISRHCMQSAVCKSTM